MLYAVCYCLVLVSETEGELVPSPNSKYLDLYSVR
jgi:hypothetical protein